MSYYFNHNQPEVLLQMLDFFFSDLDKNYDLELRKITLKAQFISCNVL